MTFDDKEAVVLEMRFQKIGVTFRPVYKVHVHQKGKGRGCMLTLACDTMTPFPLVRNHLNPLKISICEQWESQTSVNPLNNKMPLSVT